MKWNKKRHCPYMNHLRNFARAEMFFCLPNVEMTSAALACSSALSVLSHTLIFRTIIRGFICVSYRFWHMRRGGFTIGFPSQDMKTYRVPGPRLVSRIDFRVYEWFDFVVVFIDLRSLTMCRHTNVTLKDGNLTKKG